jgi:hypothetical protein
LPCSCFIHDGLRSLVCVSWPPTRASNQAPCCLYSSSCCKMCKHDTSARSIVFDKILGGTYLASLIFLRFSLEHCTSPLRNFICVGHGRCLFHCDADATPPPFSKQNPRELPSKRGNSNLRVPLWQCRIVLVDTCSKRGEWSNRSAPQCSQYRLFY